MAIAYLAVTITLVAMVVFSAVGKVRSDQHIVKVIHETVGVPMKYFARPVKLPVVFQVMNPDFEAMVGKKLTQIG